MTDTYTETATDSDNILDWTPAEALVHSIADRVTDAYGKNARLNEIGQLAMRGGIPEADGLEDGQVEELFEEVRDELAFRDNGKRR